MIKSSISQIVKQQKSIQSFISKAISSRSQSSISSSSSSFKGIGYNSNVINSHGSNIIKTSNIKNKNEYYNYYSSTTRYYSTHTAPTDTTTKTTKKTTILDIKKKYKQGIPISMVTAYDYCSAKEVDNAGIDMILVGDSLGMVMLGEKSTTNVTMEQMLHHCTAVMKGSKRAFVVGDMPFGSFESSPEEAVKSAIKLMKQGGVDAIKLEGGKKHKDKIAAIVSAGIPVMGHIGLTPQSASQLGGFRLQGKTAPEAMVILEDALALQEAGCFAIVMEMVPDIVAREITKRLSIPTIGIGAGSDTSGQVLVYHDMLGLYSDFLPKFCKQYANLSPIIQNGLSNFKQEMQERKFPSPSHTFTMKEEDSNLFLEKLNNHNNNKNILKKDSSTTTKIIDNNNNNNNNEKNNETETIYNLYVNYVNSGKDINEKVKELKEKELELKYKYQQHQHPQPQTLINNQNITSSQYNLNGKMKKKKIAVIGAGAMGSYFSAKLASKEVADVWMVSAWRDHVERINSVGLNLYNLQGEAQNIKSIKATMDALDVIKDGSYPDLVLVLVKSPATKQASLTASKLVGGNPESIVVTLQNGIGNREEIENTISGKGYKNKVWQGVTSNGAVMVGAGSVRHTGMGITYLASPLLNNQQHQHQKGMNPEVDARVEEYIGEQNKLELVQSLLNQSGINSEISYDVDGLVWGKVVVNAAINPLSAVLGVPNGYLVKNEYPMTLMRKIVGEGMEVCKAKGIKLPYGDDQEQGFKYVTDVAERTSTNYSSMLVDVIRGQPTEIKSINGVIIEEGERLDVNVEYNKMIMEMVLNQSEKKVYI